MRITNSKPAKHDICKMQNCCLFTLLGLAALDGAFGLAAYALGYWIWRLSITPWTGLKQQHLASDDTKSAQTKKIHHT